MKSPVSKVITWIPIIREVVELGRVIAGRIRARRSRRRHTCRKQ